MMLSKWLPFPTFLLVGRFYVPLILLAEHSEISRLAMKRYVSLWTDADGVPIFLDR